MAKSFSKFGTGSPECDPDLADFEPTKVAAADLAFAAKLYAEHHGTDALATLLHTIAGVRNVAEIPTGWQFTVFAELSAANLKTQPTRKHRALKLALAKIGARHGRR